MNPQPTSGAEPATLSRPVKGVRPPYGPSPGSDPRTGDHRGLTPRGRFRPNADLRRIWRLTSESGSFTIPVDFCGPKWTKRAYGAAPLHVSTTRGGSRSPRYSAA